MSLALSEGIQTAAVVVVAFVVFTLLALFLKAEASAGGPGEPEKKP